MKTSGSLTSLTKVINEGDPVNWEVPSKVKTGNAAEQWRILWRRRNNISGRTPQYVEKPCATKCWATCWSALNNVWRLEPINQFNLSTVWQKIHNVGLELNSDVFPLQQQISWNNSKTRPQVFRILDIAPFKSSVAKEWFSGIVLCSWLPYSTDSCDLDLSIECTWFARKNESSKNAPKKVKSLLKTSISAGYQSHPWNAV